MATRLRLVPYLRVSTGLQAEEGFGLAVQEQAIRRWAAAREDFRLLPIRSDEGISGTKDAADRPGLTEALNLIAEGDADGLIIYKLDRLARLLTVQEAVLAQVWRHGGRVFAVDGGEVLQDDPDDPMRTAIRQMMGVFSQLERSMIAMRLRAGRRVKGEKGGYAFGSPPYGWHSVEKELTPFEREQRGRKRILELHAEGKSLRQIIDTINAEKLTPKRAGSKWHPSTVRRVIQRAEAAG